MAEWLRTKAARLTTAALKATDVGVSVDTRGFPRSAADIDRCLIRDAQRIIESIEALARIHNAQEEDIYEYAIGG
jgi:hypothetical protein